MPTPQTLSDHDEQSILAIIIVITGIIIAGIFVTTSCFSSGCASDSVDRQRNAPGYTVTCDLGGGYYLVEVIHGPYSSTTLRLHHTELSKLRRVK